MLPQLMAATAAIAREVQSESLPDPAKAKALANLALGLCELMEIQVWLLDSNAELIALRPCAAEFDAGTAARFRRSSRAPGRRGRLPRSPHQAGGVYVLERTGTPYEIAKVVAAKVPWRVVDGALVAVDANHP